MVGGFEPPQKGLFDPFISHLSIRKDNHLVKQDIKAHVCGSRLKNVVRIPLVDEFYPCVRNFVAVKSTHNFYLYLSKNYNSYLFLLGDGFRTPSPMQERLSDREKCFLLVYGLDDLATLYQLTEKCGNLLI